MEAYIKEVQSVQLDILKELIHVLKNNNLSYVAVGGTALGAVRHKGFIPWDDDIDIAMPRADYEKFLCLQSELSSNLFIQHFKSDPEYLLYYSKVRKNNTIFLEALYKNQNMHHGIGLDVFPLDRIVKDLDREKIYTLLQSRFARTHKNYSGLLGKIKSFIYKIYYPSTEKCFTHLDAFVQQHNHQLALPLGEPHCNCYFEIDELYPIKNLDFEDIQIAVPNQIEKYLEKKYGNYMQLPEEHQRIAHKPLLVRTK